MNNFGYNLCKLHKPLVKLFDTGLTLLKTHQVIINFHYTNKVILSKLPLPNQKGTFPLKIFPKNNNILYYRICSKGGQWLLIFVLKLNSYNFEFD